MRLSVTTPLATVIEADEVTHLRAEDETGAFGILPGHADFLTVLADSVVTWRDGGGEHHVAVRGGLLEVRAGDTIAIATPEAIVSDNLHRLESEVLAVFRRQLSDERSARTDAQRLYLAALNRIIRYLRPEGAAPVPSVGRATAVTTEGFEP